MPLAEIKSVLTFAAFKADPDDSAVPWGKRFEGRKSLLLNVSRGQTSWRGITKRGKPDEGGVQEGEFADVVPQRGEEWRGMVEDGWCSVSVNHRFIISLENNLMRGDNCVSLLRTNPRSVLGPKYDRGKRYAVCHHPETTTSLLLAVEESLVKVTEDLLKTVQLRPGRVCCGLFALIEHGVLTISRSMDGGTPPNFVLVTACEGSLGVLVQQDGQWKDVRCRSGLGPDAVDTALQIISPLLSKIPQGSPVFFLGDGQDNKFRTELMFHLEKVGANDLTQDDLLWQLIGES
ncbi:MAG: hypothetical protein HS117_12960 [Verrucomicrobiaceae bacterium]|jgi:hypothetical protein|nr:hypothetical protein [Verrucomicrobiaceae bacterium]